MCVSGLCQYVTCENGGTCVDLANETSWTCDCTPGFGGPYCGNGESGGGGAELQEDSKDKGGLIHIGHVVQCVVEG